MPVHEAYFFAFLPLYLILWLGPWACLAVLMDRDHWQISIREVMYFTTLCALEFGASLQFGVQLVFGGIVGGGIVALVALLIWRAKLRRSQRVHEIIAARKPTAES
jgi:Na+/phosphate symporter